MRDNILMEELNNTCAATLFLPSLCSMLLKIEYFFSRHVQFYFLLHVLHLEKYGPIGKKNCIKVNDAEFVTISFSYCYD